MLRVKNLTYRYTDKSQTTHQYCYDFEMKPAECVAIVGKSGSGKSTLLEMMAGFLIPNSGDILWGQESLIDLPPDKRPISILFQEANLFNHLSVYKNISLGLNVQDNHSSMKQVGQNAATDTVIDDALKKLDLIDFKHRLPESLSGGQRQRIGLLRCLLRKKPILLLDEPFSGLNTELRDEFKQWIMDYKNDNQAYVVWVTHDMNDVEGVASRYFQMDNYQLTER